MTLIIWCSHNTLKSVTDIGGNPASYFKITTTDKKKSYLSGKTSSSPYDVWYYSRSGPNIIPL